MFFFKGKWAQRHRACQKPWVGSKKFARLREAASAKSGPARPQPFFRAERTGNT